MSSVLTCASNENSGAFSFVYCLFMLRVPYFQNSCPNRVWRAYCSMKRSGQGLVTSVCAPYREPTQEDGLGEWRQGAHCHWVRQHVDSEPYSESRDISATLAKRSTFSIFTCPTLIYIALFHIHSPSRTSSSSSLPSHDPVHP